MALIRYPGSKEKLAKAIASRFPAEVYTRLWSSAALMEYREPFFGAGAVGMRVLRNLDSKCRVWINDIDPGMVALWRTVRNQPQDLYDRIARFTPSVELFYQFKEEDGRTDLPEGKAGFRKLALHMMSYSGLGAKSGGPLGGRTQGNSLYAVDCRWNSGNLNKDVATFHRVLRGIKEVRITCSDFGELISDAPEATFIYLDPPYYEKGPQLYKHSMDQEAHERLAELLRACQAKWLLSYDDHPEIRRLYSWAKFAELETTYTTARSKAATRPKNREVAIEPPCA